MRSGEIDPLTLFFPPHVPFLRTFSTNLDFSFRQQGEGRPKNFFLKNC
jgi:hypothetical protein